MNLSHLNNMKIISALWTLNYGEYVAFSALIISILFAIELTNLRKSYSWIFQEHDQTSINLTDVFNIIGYFSNYTGFHEIKCL